MPGIVEHRFNQLQEIEAIIPIIQILNCVDYVVPILKNILKITPTCFVHRDVDRYVDGEADVVDYEKIINEFALLRNKWLGVLKALDQKTVADNKHY